MPAPTIVVIEDEPDIRDLIVFNLKREGFEVIGYGNGAAGLEGVRHHRPHIVILDLMLPDLDGTEICRIMKNERSTGHIPVIMVTAKGEESDVVLGLGLGADDYVTKPFSPRELVARIKAVLRRGAAKGSEPVDEKVTMGPIVVDAGRHEVRIDGAPTILTATEFRLLHFLCCHPGRVFTRDQLIGRIIGDGAIVIDRNIDVHVRSVRKKLGKHRDMIETVRGVGYRFTDVSGD